MRKIYLIIIGPDADKDLMIQRIRGLGDVYIVFGNNIFVSTTHESAREVYSAIIEDETNQQTSVVLDLGTSPSYWGYTKRELWTWLNEHSFNNPQ